MADAPRDKGRKGPAPPPPSAAIPPRMAESVQPVPAASIPIRRLDAEYPRDEGRVEGVGDAAKATEDAVDLKPKLLVVDLDDDLRFSPEKDHALQLLDSAIQVQGDQLNMGVSNWSPCSLNTKTRIFKSDK